MQNYVEVFKVGILKNMVSKFSKFFVDWQKNFMAASLCHSLVLIYFHGNFYCVILNVRNKRVPT